MKKSKWLYLSLSLLITYSAFAQTITLPGALLLKYARPAPHGVGSCSGSQLTFTTPSINQSVSVSFSFTTTSDCTGGPITSVSFSNVCVNGANAQPNTLYCVDTAGLNQLSNIAGVGAPAQCIALTDTTSAPRVICTATISCSSQGSCVYVSASPGGTLSDGGAC